MRMRRTPVPVGGDVYSWGSGEMGQLGFPLLEDLPKDQDGYPYEPTAGLIKAFERMKICQIAGGDGHTAAVSSIAGERVLAGSSGTATQSTCQRMLKAIRISLSHCWLRAYRMCA